MRQGFFSNLGRALAVYLFSALAAGAQEAPAPPRLVVQVEYFQGAKPAYESVPGSSWYARYGTVATKEPRAAGDTVRAVDVETTLVGERVQIKVGVRVGTRFHDRLDEVATYTAAAGETVEARELERVGVVPFVFRVLRVNAAATGAPTVVNKTQSIAASVTDYTPYPLPRAKVTLHNLSSKRVRSVEMRTFFQGKERTMHLVVEGEGRALMEPGGTYGKKVGVTDGRATASDFTPETIESVVVVSAVFDDYTYEGDAEGAARKMARDEGERAQLPRVMSLVRAAHAARDVESAEAVRRFRSALAALEDAAPQSSVDRVFKNCPSLAEARRDDVKAGVEVSMHHLRTELLEGLAQFEGKYQAAPAENSFKRWLAERQARLEGWLARL